MGKYASSVIGAGTFPPGTRATEIHTLQAAGNPPLEPPSTVNGSCPKDKVRQPPNQVAMSEQSGGSDCNKQ